MNLNKYEHLIKEKMQSFQPDVDKDELWKSLVNHVPATKRKKKKRFVFLLFFFFLLGIVTTIWFFDFNKENATENIQTGISKTKSRIKENSIETIDKSIIENRKNHIFIEDESKVPAKDEQRIEKNNKSKKILTNNINKNEVAQKYPAQRKMIDNSFEFDHENQPDLLKRNKINKLDPASIGQQHIVYEHKILLKPKINTIYFKNSQNMSCFAWNVAAGTGGVDHVYMPLNAESEVFTDYFDSKTKPSWQIEIGLSYYFSKRIYLSTGLQFTQLVTQLHPKWERILNEQNPYYNGLTQRVLRQAKYEAIGHNYQNVLDLPLRLGIRTLKIERLKLFFEAGYLINIYTYSKGVIVDDQYKLHYYDNNKTNPYSNFSGAWEFSTVLDYNFSNCINIYLKSGLSQRKIKYKYSSIEIIEKYNTYNFKIGINYKFIKW